MIMLFLMGLLWGSEVWLQNYFVVMGGWGGE